LKQYEEIHRAMDCWVVFEVESTDHVFTWRLEAEHRMREETGAGLLDDQVI